MSNYVMVCDSRRRPLMPCHPARARELLSKGKAAVLKYFPFTIVLKYEVKCSPQPVTLGIDPGSKVTGMAVTVHGFRGARCILGINLTHRGQAIRDKLLRRAKARRNRRNRNTRYRPIRVLNRRRLTGWLPPSLTHRILTTETWVKRLVLAIPVSTIEIETVSFDTQKMADASIKGIAYKHGTLHGYKVRAYLLERHNYICQYCNGLSKDIRLEVEHKTPRMQGGTDSIDNLTLACHLCNQNKGNRTLKQWLDDLCYKTDHLSSRRRDCIGKVMSNRTISMRDAAAVNTTNKKLVEVIQQLGILTISRPAYMTKYNRHRLNQEKDHWIDAAMLGGVCHRVYISKSMTPMAVKAMGIGSRQMCAIDKYGFPRSKPKGPSCVAGFRTGDVIRLTRHGVTCVARAALTKGRIRIEHQGVSIEAHPRNCISLHRSDGYSYTR